MSYHSTFSLESDNSTTYNQQAQGNPTETLDACGTIYRWICVVKPSQAKYEGSSRVEERGGAALHFFLLSLLSLFFFFSWRV
jgi:hypothetical protein